jgi:hypothetical protein
MAESKKSSKATTKNSAAKKAPAKKATPKKAAPTKASTKKATAPKTKAAPKAPEFKLKTLVNDKERMLRFESQDALDDAKNQIAHREWEIKIRFGNQPGRSGHMVLSTLDGVVKAQSIKLVEYAICVHCGASHHVDDDHQCAG